MGPTGRPTYLRVTLAAALLGFLPGCFGVSQNPSYFPHLIPTGDIVRTHAKPPGKGYFSDFDPHACRLEVRPLDATNPVRSSHVLIATVYDEKGQPRRNRRVEWMLEGDGNIVEVDESGFFPGRGYKVDNKYAVSYTNYCEHKITRGNGNPNDDFVVRPGQTYCVITSAVEGDSHLTIYAPEIYNWDNNKVIVTKHWVDAEWIMPPPAVNRAGTEHVFTTTVLRHTDHQPLANYRVRYRILDGPPARFLPSQTQEAVVISDLGGNANVTLGQVAPQAGVNRIGIEIIRPPDPCSPSGAGIVIGTGQTTKEWQAPAVALTKTGPPTAVVGGEVPYTINVTNTSKVETQGLTVREVVPDGLQYLRSDPPAIVEGNQLTWTLAGLPPGRDHNLHVFFRALRVGPITNCAKVTGGEGVQAENCVTTQVTAPQLTVSKTGPATGFVNVPINYQITLTNPGTGPANNVLLSDKFDPGLEHESGANPVELQIGTLAPGETKVVPITLMPRRPGTLVNRVRATAEGNLTAQAEHPVNVQVAQLSLTKTGPQARYVDRPAKFDITVANPGDVPVSNVVVRDQLPAELSFVQASDGGQPGTGQVIWNLGTLQPREQKILQVETKCLQIASRVVNVALATADPGVQVRAEAALEIRGVPAFRLEVIDVDDPVEVGARTQYKIDVTNQGSLPGDQVEIIAIVPKEMRILGANGPTTPTIDGQRVVFPPVNSLQPKQTINYRIDVQALQPGDLRFRAELRSSTLKDPVIEEESTTVYAPVNPPGSAPRGPGTPPAGPPPPGPGESGTPPAAPTPPLGPPAGPPAPTPPVPLPPGPPAPPSGSTASGSLGAPLPAGSPP